MVPRGAVPSFIALGVSALCLSSRLTHAFVPSPDLSSIATIGRSSVTVAPLRRASVRVRPQPLRMGFLDDLVKGLQGGGGAPATTKTSAGQYPKVEIPPDFSAPDPRPLTLTRASDLPSTLKSAAALAIRLATGVFVLGWRVDSIFAPEEAGKYAPSIGPFCLRDSSSVLGDAPRPERPLILYEYDASPYCKRVRETLNLLDLTVEYRPCPGARAGFADELLERTSRRTVPYLVDPNTGEEMFESAAQIEYLLNTYGPPPDAYDRKALWTITFEGFSVATSSYAEILRDMPGARRRPDSRPDNENMRPLELWGYK